VVTPYDGGYDTRGRIYRLRWLLSSVLLRRVDWNEFTNVLEVCTASNIRVRSDGSSTGL
jgi:hypothetical protein